MRTISFILTLFFLAFYASSIHAVTIHVPDDFPTIQAAIDACVDGDTVLVADGTYIGDGNRNIDFGGRAIVVMSENGPVVTIIDCQNAGRGFYFHSGEGLSSVVKGFTITNGSGGEGGGGIYCFISSPTIVNCTINDNTSEQHGGGMLSRGGNPTVANCTFSRNRSEFGGGMLNDISSSIVTNCTFSGNTAWADGGGMANNGGRPTITNCILWGDVPPGIINNNSNPTVTYSNVQGGYPGVGNIDVDPRFVSFQGFDYLLRPYSPCVDKGDPAIEDFIYDWHPHWPDWYPNHSRSDMGAYGGPGNVGWLR